MSSKEYILFIDSGIGGLSILKEFLNKKPNTNIIYYADTFNFPYGLKEEDELGTILYNIYISLYEDYKISLIVIACNTASVSALDYLRGRVTIPIIGTVPAVKLAASITKNNNIGIIATETTIRLNYIDKLVKEFASNKKIFLKSSAKLVEAAENFYSTEEIKKIVEEELSLFKKQDIDCLVLGCTHYSFLFEEINDFFEQKVHIIDSREGVSKRIIQLMSQDVLSEHPDKILLLSSSDKDIIKKYKRFNEIIGLFDNLKIKEPINFKYI